MINDIKDLQKLFKLCRAQGVTNFKFNGVEVIFGDMPQVPHGTMQSDEISTDNPYANFPSGELTPEQLMFYSSGGKPDEDPFNKEAAG